MKKVGFLIRLLIILSFVYLTNPGLVFASNGWTTYNTSSGLTNDYVRSTAVDGSYNWLGTEGGVSRFNEVPIADLTISTSDISFSPSSPTEGNTVTVSVLIHNVGLLDANDFQVDFYVDAILKTYKSTSVSSSSTSIIQFDWTSIQGDHQITIIVDALDDVPESDNIDNIATKKITVGETTTPSTGGGGGAVLPITLISAGATEMTSATYSDILITLSAGGKIDKDRFVETSDTLCAPLLLTKRYPLPTDPTVAQFARTVEKVTGDVYALAAEASEYTGFTFGAHENKLVIARGDLGVDSMAAVAYAKVRNIPILLVKPNEMPSVTENAISKMMAVKKREIIIVGGTVAVSTAVEEKLAEMGDVKRIYGETRVETAVALAEEAYPDKNKVRAIVITDYENPKIDAALMSYVLDAPLLYVKSDGLSPTVKEYILNHKETIFEPTKVVLMGVDPKVASEINDALK